MKVGLIVVSILLLGSVVSAKKKKKSGGSKKENLFDNKTLNCLVCKALVDEIEALINKIDPAKKVEVGSHRLNGDGTQSKRLVSLQSSCHSVVGRDTYIPVGRCRTRGHKST